MHKRRLVISILATLLGIFMIIYGGYDDSPGGQLLGLVILLAGAVGMIKSRKKTPDSFHTPSSPK